MDKYVIEITYDEDETSFKISKSSNIIKLRNFIEMYYENLRTTFYKIIYNNRNISEDENDLNMPLSLIFGDVKKVELKIERSLEDDLLHRKWRIKCNFKGKYKLFEMLPVLNFEKFKFNILSSFPELEQENYMIIYNNIDITNIYSNNTLIKNIFGDNINTIEPAKRPNGFTQSIEDFEKSMNLKNNIFEENINGQTEVQKKPLKRINPNEGDIIEITITIQPKTIVKLYKICSFCHLVIANYICNKCAIASCERCSPKDKHIRTKDKNLIKIENFRDCDYSYEDTTLQSYLNKLEEYLQKCRMNKTENFSLNRKEKINLIKSKYDEIHKLVDEIKKVQISNLEKLLDKIQKKYLPDKFIPNYQELYNKIFKYKSSPFYDVEESMKKIIEFGLLLGKLVEDFDNFLKDYLEFYTKYKKCMEIIHKIFHFLENCLIDSKIIFKNDVDIFRYRKILKIYDSSHVLVYDPNDSNFYLMNFHDEKNIFKKNFNNYIQANFSIGPDEKLFIITGSTSQKFFVYDLKSNEMQYVSTTKYSHNWWPSIIPFKKEDDTKISIVLFCLGGSYTTKCEILYFMDKLKTKEEVDEKENKENIDIENNNNNNEIKEDISVGGEEVNNPDDNNPIEGEIIDDKIIPLNWYRISSTGVNHGQAGSFILNNKYLFLLFGYDYNLKPVTRIEKINIKDIIDNPISQVRNIKWKMLDFKNPDNISSILYYNSILKKSEEEVFILGGLKEIGQVDCIYKYDPRQNILSKTDNLIPFKNVKFQNEKNFYLINKLSDLEEENLIKYKEKIKQDNNEDNNGMNKNNEEDKKEEKIDSIDNIEIKGIKKSREFAIIDSNNQVHIIKADTFEHFSNEFIPVQ